MSAAVLAFLSLAACQDQPVGPSMAAPPARESGTAAGGLHTGQVPFVCVVTRPAAQARFGAEARRTTIYFPRAEVAPDGRTIRYSYVRADAKQWYGAADCTIPRTEAAVRRMDRVFDAEAPGVVRTARGFGSGNMQIMGCVAEGACTIEGITVTAPPQQQQTQLTCDVNDPTCGTGGTGGYSWYGSGADWTGGGDYGGWATSGDTDGNGDYSDEGPIAYAICVAAALGPGGWVALGLTAMTAYDLWGARVDVQNAYDEWKRYSSYMYSAPHVYDPEMDRQHQLRYNDMQPAEQQALRNLVGVSAVTFAELWKAVNVCAPAAAAPV